MALFRATTITKDTLFGYHRNNLYLCMCINFVQSAYTTSQSLSLYIHLGFRAGHMHHIVMCDLHFCGLYSIYSIMQLSINEYSMCGDEKQVMYIQYNDAVNSHSFPSTLACLFNWSHAFTPNALKACVGPVWQFHEHQSLQFKKFLAWQCWLSSGSLRCTLWHYILTKKSLAGQ